MRLLVLLLLAGCFSKPTFEPKDGAVTGDVAADLATGDAPLYPVPRLIADAWYSDNYPQGGPAMGPVLRSSAGMGTGGYEISTSGVQEGDVLLFVGSIDNGNMNLWELPTGFVKLDEQFFGQDNETFVVAWKTATKNEPATYTGAYLNGGIASAASAISLIAISGAKNAQPLATTDIEGTDQMPIFAASKGTTVLTPNTTLIYASGADWHAFTGTTTFVQPNGYAKLTAFGDHGDDTASAGMWDWTSQQIAWSVQAAPGATGVVTGEFQGSAVGCAWTMLIAIESAR